MSIARQPVYRLDGVLHERSAVTMVARTGRGELPASEKRVDDPHERTRTGTMSDYGVAFESRFQEPVRVPAVLSDPDGCVATPIRSDGSMHVDPLSNCIPSPCRRSSWGYLSKALLRTRIDAGCFSGRFVRAAELGR